MLHQELFGIRAVEGPRSRQQLLKADGEAVLIRKSAGVTFERFRCGVDRRHAARNRSATAFERLRQSEIRDFDVLVEHEEILRFNIQVLDVIVVVHQVERFGRFGEILEQFVAGDSRFLQLTTFAESIP